MDGDPFFVEPLRENLAVSGQVSQQPTVADARLYVDVGEKPYVDTRSLVVTGRRHLRDSVDILHPLI